MVYGGKMIKKTKQIIDDDGNLVEVVSAKVSASSNDVGDLENKPSFEWLPSSESDHDKADVEDPLQSLRD